ncbi:cobalamin biosynthesis protein CobQ [Fertoebacter nigrum]|uniref:Cobalamin biosynthesis protein CobQ n=1 Tax=Fertoeibacter niger TaxID=2656921 RepID=A0A8X8GWF7_9RHOB|nr:cobalamin biosynthesis protein CobQ [Fertoeibacter niger]NUB43138.1 cobalamin biosynthesis protein CobQ [Fertoeibacter niger]
MNTPAHLIFGLAAFGRPDRRDVTAAALAGALAPDVSLYLLAGWSLLVMDIPPQVVFGQLYFSPLWQGIFAVDNSLPLWGVLLAAGLVLRAPVLVAFAGAGLLHLAFDVVLHNEDARRQFWPLTDWVFRSPFSYWDTARHGAIIGPLEVAVSLALCGVLWRRYRGWVMRGIIAALAVAECAPGLVFFLMFRG